MKRRELLKNLAIAMPALYFYNGLKANTLLLGQSLQEQIAKGPFQSDWQSLKQHHTAKKNLSNADTHTVKNFSIIFYESKAIPVRIL